MNIEPNNALKPKENHAIAGQTQRMVEQLLALPRMVKKSILITADFFMAVLCLFFALSLRFGYIDRFVIACNHQYFISIL